MSTSIFSILLSLMLLFNKQNKRITPLNEEKTKVVFEVIHKRRKKSSTVFCSQFLDEGWYDRIGSTDSPLADSIMDRIKYDSYKIKISATDPDHDRSMREVYGLRPNEAE